MQGDKLFLLRVQGLPVSLRTNQVQHRSLVSLNLEVFRQLMGHVHFVRIQIHNIVQVGQH